MFLCIPDSRHDDYDRRSRYYDEPLDDYPDDYEDYSDDSEADGKEQDIIRYSSTRRPSIKEIEMHEEKNQTGNRKERASIQGDTSG